MNRDNNTAEQSAGHALQDCRNPHWLGEVWWTETTTLHSKLWNIRGKVGGQRQHSTASCRTSGGRLVDRDNTLQQVVGHQGEGWWTETTTLHSKL